MRRIVIIGVSGAGKTTLARQLASHLNVPHIELDALHWEPNWNEAETDVFRARVGKAIDAARDGWTACGNYRKAQDLIWPGADTIIWLDYPMREVFTRCFVRTMRRWWEQQALWNGNRERLWTQFFSRESILLWVINTWRMRRREYAKVLRSDVCRHLRVLRFASPEQTEAWLARVGGC
jgi:adenylate kinase family enzyme